MIAVRAAWVCPIDHPPLAPGWVAVEDGRIADYGEGQPPAELGAVVRDLGAVAVMPALVNAHTHLELSWLRTRVPPAADFISWVAQLFLARGRTPPRADDPEVREAAIAAGRELRECGTVAVGDVSNTLASVPAFAEAGLSGIIFHELLGFAERDGRLIEETASVRAGLDCPPHVRVSVAPHAPYSVSPELFLAIRQAVHRSDVPQTTVHLGEAVEEMELLASGGGPWPGLLRRIGSWRDDWRPPATDPVTYLDQLGMLDQHTLVVHGVQLGSAALDALAARDCTLVTCPRSNIWVGAGAPPIADFYQSGVRVAVGTDSLASVADLNLFSELKEMRWLAPEVPASSLLNSATLCGAEALGLGDELGSLTVGKRAELLSVRPQAPVDDVEEFLVSGIQPQQVQWVNTAELRQ